MPDTNLSKGPPNITELENLFINNDALEKIESFLERFNPIRVMRMENMEIRHSAILAWLLDPNESHGLNDIFLKSFLAAALKGTDHSPPTALEIIQADLGDAQISRERHNIDIFIYCPRNAWSFVIENKYHSSQNDGQLQRYRERAEKDAEDSGKVLHSRGIFLTLHEEEPKDDSYATIRYRDVTEILSSHIKLRGDNLSAEVCLFLKHYLEIIEEAAGMSKPKENMQALAKQLYRTHRRVIDFIVEHGASTEFAFAAETLIGQDMQYGKPFSVDEIELVFFAQNKFQLSFLPTLWREALDTESQKSPWAGCEGWWAGYPMICWFQLNTSDTEKGKIFLYAEVGPLENYQLRKALIEGLSNLDSQKIQFRADATRDGALYSKFFKGNSKSVSDVNDSEQISSAMRKLLDEFSDEFERIGKFLSDFRKSIEA